MSAALDDAQLRAAMLRASGPMPGLDRWSVPKVRADLVNWCRAVYTMSFPRALEKASP